MQAVHRVLYTIRKGPIPSGMDVLHKCDERRCCNPEHLFLGTNDDNIRDKCLKDRSGKKLSIGKVKEIKHMLKAGLSQRVIACQFGVRQPAISKIKSGAVWAHVTLSERA